MGFSNGIFNDPQKVGKGYRLINVKNMYSGDCIDVDSLSLIDIDEKEFKNNKVEYGDIFFTRSSLVKEGIAYSNVNLSYRNDLTFDGHLIRMQPCKTTTDPVFLAYLFKTSSARKQLILGGKTTTMTTIGQSDIAIVELALPSYKPEQSQIGTYFQNLDQLITLHQAKYNKLVNIKKAMLEKMFPKNGADVPEIRFKGFIDAWEKRKLGEIMNVTSVKRIHQSDWTNSGIRFLRARDIVSAYKNEEPSDYLYISENKYNEYSIISGKVKPNDLLVTGVGTIGIPLLIADDIPIYFKDGNIIWFKNENAIDGKFFFYSFINNRIQGFIKDSAGTGTVGTYTIDSGKKTPILLPKDKEQRKIGNYFQNLDKQITLHQKELEKLKNIKKACLEKMFV